jgi:kynurenine formamidase
VLLDIAALRGVPHLQAGDAITPEDIEGAMRRQGVEVGRGDVVLLHTGWMDAVARQDPLRYANTEPGLGVPGGEFLAAREVVAVGLDVAQMDPIGRADDHSRPVHEVLLTRHGIYCLENVVTGALARDRAYEFLFVANPVRYKGAAQAPLAPVAVR